ncbi:hypothetical protein AVEN_101985-1 [Araneus ventricosus]|uniref:Uncharacterized protein n=1 Tax=Araneus ventricosus TaxID=182803 RepID=A0A4Y2L4R4_ARAVE|nr:hypothetical protein AVEN_101985-1 [Araneus ventricosus]
MRISESQTRVQVMETSPNDVACGFLVCPAPITSERGLRLVVSHWSLAVALDTRDYDSRNQGPGDGMSSSRCGYVSVFCPLVILGKEGPGSVCSSWGGA